MKRLRPGDVVLRRRGSFALWLIHFVFGLTISLFFRRIELFDSEKLPAKGGLIFVSNHPNALIDPALLFIALPRRIAFLAKSTLFKIPVFSYLLRTVGALPLYRQQDAGADVSKNQETFAVARELLKKGGALAIFPEGVSHNAPQLQPLKTGAARIALGAVSVGQNPGSLDLHIVPVGLFYTSKMTFRSEALLYFGQPVRVLPVELDADGQPPREEVRRLTASVEEALREVTLNAESESQLVTARIAEEVFTSATEHEENLAERLEFLRAFIAEPPAGETKSLEQRLLEFEQKLDRFGLDSEFLALTEYSKWFVFKQALIRSWYLVILLPFALAGAVLHFPAYQIVKFLAYMQLRKGHLDMASTVKVLASVVLMPLTWLTAAAVLFHNFGWAVALFAIPLSFLCGYIALRTLEEIEDLRGWTRAILFYLRRRRKFLKLVAERKSLFEQLNKGK